jgi:hypothetical protein
MMAGSAALIGALTWGLILAVRKALPDSTDARLNRWWPLIAVAVAVALSFAPVEIVRAVSAIVGMMPPEATLGPGDSAATGALGGAVATLLHAVIRTTARGR